MEKSRALGLVFDRLTSEGRLDAVVAARGRTAETLLLLDTLAELVADVDEAARRDTGYTAGWNDAVKTIIDDLLRGVPASFPLAEDAVQARVAWLRGKRLGDLEQHNRP